jgi:DNA replication protein DnaC
MMTTRSPSDEAARAQAALDQKRSQQPSSRRRRDSFGELFSEAEKLRLPALRDQVRAEVAETLRAEGLPEELLEVAVDMRARQLLREELDPDWAAKRKQEELARSEAEFRERLGAWRYPEKVIGALFTGKDPGDVNQRVDLYETDALQWLRAAWAARKQIMCLVGSLGTGKTIAACMVPYETKQRDVLFVTANEVFSKSDRYDGDRPWLERVERAAVLIIDECGRDTERKETDSKRLADLLHARFENNRRTIVLANIGRAEFTERYTDAVLSRIYESGGMHVCKQIVRRGELRRQQQLKLGGRDGQEES